MTQKQVEQQKFNPEQFISKNHESILKDHNLKIQINYENGIYKPLVTPIDKNMTDAQIAENMKKAMTEIANQSTKGPANDAQAKSFNMLMAALVQNADNKTFQKIENADQKLLAIEFKNILENSTVKIGSKSSESSTQGQETSSTDTREIWLITQKELDKILSNLEKMKAFHVTKEEAPKIVKAVQESETLTKRFKTEKNEGIGLGTGAKKNEELTQKEVTGAVIIRSDPLQEEKIKEESNKISDKYKQFREYSIDPIKEKEKFGFYEKDGVLMVRMKHAPKKGQKEGEWKDSVLSDKDGLKAETIKDLCYVANIYKSDSSTKSREKNGLNLAQAKEIRKIITDTVFSIEGVQEAFNQANKQYKKDRSGYELSRDGFAAGYLYEILKQKK